MEDKVQGEEITINYVLFIGDPHFKCDNVEQTSAYANECIKAYRELKKKYGAQIICLLAGDILDGHGVIQGQCLNRAIAFINELSDIGLVYVLIGNHDYFNNTQYLTDNHWMNCLKRSYNNGAVVIVDKPIIVDQIVMMPYIPTGKFQEALDNGENTRNNRWKTARMVFAHQEIRGVKLSSLTKSVNGDVWSENWPHLVSGHIHSRQQVANNVWYPGSVIQHSFGDVGDSTISVIKVPSSHSTSKLVYTDIHINVPTKRYIDVSSNDITNGVIDKFIYNCKPLEKIKVRIILDDRNHKKNVLVQKFVKNLPSTVGVIFNYEKTLKKSLLDETRSSSSSSAETVNTVKSIGYNYVDLVRADVYSHPNESIKNLYHTVILGNK
ncbi:hypothetical protein [Trichoplusia ni ascovirus 2c]|uniref:hypothetical protein n=1 Tax=Trichoplusia ni ascovirus 2c TaxID=328615 RepID=UPI0000E44251|nr:hypothetical protein TNAV2c_gp121 [Trichoplusia ni ascovirus 2c]ABF70638.1 hypothetical protein [Trichoplusia ni ascovirus 2c]